MDPVTATIISQAATALIQGAFSYMEQAGLSEEEMDALFAKERARFKARHFSFLPPPNLKPSDGISVDPMPPDMQEQWKEEHGEAS